MGKLKVAALVLLLGCITIVPTVVYVSKSEYTGTVDSVYVVTYHGTTSKRCVFYCDQLKRRVDVRIRFNDAVNLKKGHRVSVSLSRKELEE